MPEQLKLQLDEPRQPDPQVGDKVRVMSVGWYQAWPGAPVEHPVRVIDGVLQHDVPPGTEPHLVSPHYFGPRSRPSKYRRVVVMRTFPNGRIKGEVVTLDKTTKIFKYDLAE